MIGVLSQGRLGNQMFQFAFGWSASRKLKTNFFFEGNHSLHYFELYQSFDKNNKWNVLSYVLNNFFYSGEEKVFKRPLRAIPSNIRNYFVRKRIVEWPNKLGESDYLLKDLHDNLIYSGFFQSEEYFIQYKQEILQFFRVKGSYQDAFSKAKSHLFKKKTVAVHLRRTDYASFGGEELGGYDMTLPVAYYHRCLGQIDGLNDYNVIFVSDDIEFARTEFGQKENFYFECNNEITDFQILHNADIIITANSTFSWWAAWLNTKNNNKVFAPKYFLGFKVNQYYPAGIRVKNWEWIDVN